MSTLPTKRLKMTQCEDFQDDLNPKTSIDDSERENVPLQFLDLNDDCLYTILNHVSDLTSVARSCKKLKRISTNIFARKHQTCDFDSIGVTDSVMVKRLLTTFGSSIVKLRIDFDAYWSKGAEIVETILRYCENLKSLSMETYEIPDSHDEISNVKLLFGKLETLHIKYVTIEWPDGYADDDFVTPNGHEMDIFENCSSLIDLKIEECIDFEHIAFVHKFPKLQHFYYACGYKDNLSFLKDTWVPGFILRHRNLKSLRLNAFCRYADVLRLIYCKELENLEFCTDLDPNRGPYFDCAEYLLAYLGQVDRLKELKIFWRGQGVTLMLEEFHRSKSLHALHLKSVQGGCNLLQSVSGIKTLRCLKLSGVELHSLGVLARLTELTALFIVHESGDVESDFDLARMVTSLINLKKLQFRVKNYRISRCVYFWLVSAVECRPVVTNRYLQVDCYTTGDFNDLLRPTVEFKTFEQGGF